MYNRSLKYPANLPVLDLGTKQKSNYVPAELCEIEPGCAYRGRLLDMETAAMIKVACRRPRENADAIVDIGFPSLGLSPPSNQQQTPSSSPLAPFGVEIDRDMAVIPARELPAPSLSYRGNNTPRVSNGSWNLLDVKFHRSAQISSWYVLVVRDGRKMLEGPNDPNLKQLVEGFARKLGHCGMSIPPNPPPIQAVALLNPSQDDSSRSRSVQMLRDTFEKMKKPGFILVLLETRDNYIYPAVKVSSLLSSHEMIDMIDQIRKSVIRSWVYRRSVCNFQKHLENQRNKINISRTLLSN